MDVTTLLTSIAPQAGIGGVLLILLAVATRNAATDRGDYRAALDAAQARHAAELERVNSAHDAEVAELKFEVADLRSRVDQLAERLDEERRARWLAEDAAAQAQRPGRTRRAEPDNPTATTTR